LFALYKSRWQIEFFFMDQTAPAKKIAMSDNLLYVQL